MSARRWGKDMLLFKLFVSTAPTPDVEKSAAAQAMTRMGFRCADCVLCEEHTVEDAAELHERSLDEILEAINAVPDPKPEETTAWKLAEAVKALEQEHFAAMEKSREEIAAGLAAARASWTAHSKPPPRRGEGLLARMVGFFRPAPKDPAPDEKIWMTFEKMIHAQEEYQKKRAQLVGKEFGAALDEYIVGMLLGRKGLPELMPAVFPGIEARPEELAKWAAMFDASAGAAVPATCAALPDAACGSASTGDAPGSGAVPDAVPPAS